MDFLLINSRNIKISLSESELSANGVTANSLDWNAYNTRRMMQKLLVIAREQYGFEWETFKLSVSVFPSVDGGCELYVTKSKKPPEKNKPAPSVGTICFCEKAEDVFCICEILKKRGFSGLSSLYLSENGKFVLVCERKIKLPSYIKNADAQNTEFDLSFLSEHGITYEATESAIYYISEHMTPLAKSDAVKKIIGTF